MKTITKSVRFIVLVCIIMLFCTSAAFADDAPKNYLIQVGGKYVTSRMKIKDLKALLGEPKHDTRSCYGGRDYTFYGDNYSDYLYIGTNNYGNICAYGSISEGFSTPKYAYGDTDINATKDVDSVKRDPETGELLAVVDVTYTGSVDDLFNHYNNYSDYESASAGLSEQAAAMFNGIRANWDLDGRINYDKEIQAINEKIARGRSDLYEYCRNTDHLSLVRELKNEECSSALPNPLDLAMISFDVNTIDDRYNNSIFTYRWDDSWDPDIGWITKKWSTIALFQDSGIIKNRGEGKAHIKIETSFNNDIENKKTNTSVALCDSNGKEIERINYTDMKGGSADFGYYPAGDYSIKVEDAGEDDYVISTKCSIDCASGSQYDSAFTEGQSSDGFTVEEYDTAFIYLRNTYKKEEDPDPVDETGTLKIAVSFEGMPTTSYKNRIMFTVTGPGRYSKTLKYSEDFANDVCEIHDLLTGEYTVSVSGADISDVMDYDLVTSFTVDGKETNKVTVNKDSVSTVEIAHKYEHYNGVLKIRAVFDDTLTTAEKNAVRFTVKGTDGFDTQTKKYSEFTDGTWDLGQVSTGTYIVTAAGAVKNGYTSKCSYKFSNEDEKALDSDDNYIMFKVIKGEATTLEIEHSFSKTEDPVKSISNAKVKLNKKYSYTGNNIKPKPVVTVDGKVLVWKKDYTITYNKNCKNIGTYKLTVKGKGNYQGSVSQQYTIIPDIKLSKPYYSSKDKYTHFKITPKANLKPKKGNNVKYYIEIYSDKELKKCIGYMNYTQKDVYRNGQIGVFDSYKKSKVYYVRLRLKKGKKYISDWSNAKSFRGKC
ncbi:MAG: hypothetical protein IJH41_03685 [Eubacterium sp.]|nr:hypothetical protein [Eubacterium sp.]